MKWFENNPVTVLLLTGLCVFVVHLDTIPVTIMEARNFITAREMITEGHWLLTTMNDLPRYEKPPLPSWITAVFGLIFGVDHVAALRLPTMLMAIMLGYMVYRFSMQLLQNKLQSMLNALILLTSFYVIVITIEAPWDSYTHGFMLVAIYFLYAFFSKLENQWKHGLLAGLFIGLSFMSKGPVSLYALLLPFLIAYGIVYKFRGFTNQKKQVPLVVMLLLAAAVGIWWFLYVRLADPGTFLQITAKETANWGSYNVRPFYYYWSFFVQGGIWTIPALIGLLYPYLKDRVSDPKAYRLTLLWTLFSLLLLSLIPEKKARYLVPVLIPLAMNTGFYIEYVLRSFKNEMSVKERIPMYVHFGVLGLIGIAFPFVAYSFLRDGLDGFWGYYSVASLCLVTIGVLLFIQVKRNRLLNAFLLTIALVASIKLFVLPLYGALEKNQEFKHVSELCRSPFTEGNPIYVFGEIAPEMIWAYGTSIPVLKGPEEITIPDGEQFGVLVVPSEEDEFKRIFDLEHVCQLQTTYDMNYNASPGNKGHKNRLVSKLYEVKKR